MLAKILAALLLFVVITSYLTWQGARSLRSAVADGNLPLLTIPEIATIPSLSLPFAAFVVDRRSRHLTKILNRSSAKPDF
jgi:hypothetical protein